MNVHLPTHQIEEFCHRWKIIELEIFGSTARGDFGSQSDLDFLVTFQGDADWSLLDHAAMEIELEALLNRKVDLVSRCAVERSENMIRRQAILSGAVSVYRAAA